MNLKVPKTHTRYRIIPEVTKISEPIFKDTGYINFRSHVRQYDNGLSFDMGIDEDWADNFYSKYLFDGNNTKKRIKTGINLWKNNKNENVQTIFNDSRENFNIDGRIEFIYRDERKKCYNFYSFCTTKKLADKAYTFYDMHRAKLLKFIAYFNREAAHLIEESNKPENLIKIPNYTSDDIEDPLRDYAVELERDNPNTKISDREFEIMLIYAAGYTTKNIAKMLYKSEKTIESHIHSVKQKYGFPDRISMKRYLIAKGYDGLERFFFNYFPDDRH